MGSIFYIAVIVAMTVQVYGDDITVQVEQGTLLGEKVTSVTKELYYSFKGIPYAQPPVGKLRFLAPQPPHSWEGVRNATQHGSICPQFDILANVYLPGSENCLSLNVYTPDCNPTEAFPVIVVIHGGAFKFGSGNVDLYGPDFLVPEAVVVTFNYRLDTLGFLSLGTCEVPGNAAFKDQVAVLKWVKKNIANFGGDANKVTLLGGTAGGSSVGFHMLSPLSKGLFHRAIAMSGAPTCDFGISYKADRRASVFANNLGYAQSNATNLLEFLQSVDYNKLVNSTISDAAILASEATTLIPFKMQPFTSAVIESKKCPGSFITEDPFKAVQRGHINNADFMFSYNSDEALVLIQPYATSYIDLYNKTREMFTPSKLLISSTPDIILEAADKITEHFFGDKKISVDNIAEFIEYGSDAGLVYDVERFYWRLAERNRKRSYFFIFSSYSDNRNQYGKQGAAYGIYNGTSHFDDLYYLFDPKKSSLPLDQSSEDYRKIQNIVGAVLSFAKIGKPTPDSTGKEWPKFNMRSRPYMLFEDDMTVSYASNERFLFWKSIYELAGQKF